MSANLKIIVQARSSSSRIPNKVLKEVGGKSLLEHTIYRLSIENPQIPIIVCTSNLQSDLPIINICKKININCFRGSLLNVASRYFEICKNSVFDAFIRICADSPMIDGALVKMMTNNWQQSLDLLTNKSPRTFPKGQSIEIVNRTSFLKFYEEFESNDDFEHVTHYFHRNLDRLRYENIRNSEDHSKISLTIDIPEDLLRFESFAKQYGPDWVDLPFDKILEIYPKT